MDKLDKLDKLNKLNKKTIITNNPDVAALYPEASCYLNVDVLHIFIALRDAIHKGGRLISHPLSGSIKPTDNPYKSVVLLESYGQALDYKSLHIIEMAIIVLKKLSKKRHCYSEAVLEDFRVIDLDLLNSAVKG